ncbi:unnamed protein product, partial [Urochloa humidicola]
RPLLLPLRRAAAAPGPAAPTSVGGDRAIQAAAQALMTPRRTTGDCWRAASRPHAASLPGRRRVLPVPRSDVMLPASAISFPVVIRIK